MRRISSLSITNTSVSCSAVTVALRGSPVRSDISPKKSPVPTVLIGVALASFALISLLATLYGGHQALHVLSLVQVLVYFGSFLLLAILFAVAVLEQIIPGSKRRVKPGVLMAGAALFLIALAPVLFENFGTVNDVHIARDWRTGEPLSYAFVEMPFDGEAEYAIEKLDGKRWSGRRLKVSEKQEGRREY